MRSSLVSLACAIGLAACGGHGNPCPPAEAPVPATCRADCRDVYVVAHEDDDVLFLNPDIATALDAGHSITVVYVTAGDLGDPTRDQYWEDRERGILAAYLFMLRGGDPTEPPAAPAIDAAWHAATDTADGLTFTRYHTDDRGRAVDLVFLRLGDAQTACLWQNIAGCSTLNPFPFGPDYVAFTRAAPGNGATSAPPLAMQKVTRDELIAVLADILVQYQPHRVGTTDFSSLHFDALGGASDSPGYSEYWDHYYVGLFTLAAVARVQATSTAPIEIAAYRGYTIARLPANLDHAAACRKLDTFARYAVFDSSIVKPAKQAAIVACPACALTTAYGLDSPTSWQRRVSADRTLTWNGARRLRNGTRCLGLDAGGAPVMTDCATATTWLASGRRLAAADGSVCLTVGDAGQVVAGGCVGGGAEAVFIPFDNGQVRTGDARCLAVTGDATASADCQATRADGHVQDTPVPEQHWVVEP